jgi:hypothetical protein
VLNYFFCALVSPDFEGDETYDLKRFHECEGPTYILVFVAIVAIALVENFAAGTGLARDVCQFPDNMIDCPNG